MGNEDLGKHYQSIGEYIKAQESFQRMRADVSANKHIVDISKHLISVAIEQQNWMMVNSQIQRLRSLPSAPEEALIIQPYMSVTAGLAQLSGSNYYEAAILFVSTLSGSHSLNHVASPNDIAIYGGLCALATMERAELQSRVLDNPDFRTYLELEPHIRRAIGLFINSRYSACLAILENYRADYELDLYLQPHVSELYRLVRSKSIMQYFIPFSCVTLESMDEAFASPGKTIDSELADMIEVGTLDARIDTQNRVCSLCPAPTLHSNHVLGPQFSSYTPACQPPDRSSLHSKEVQPRGSPSYPMHEPLSCRP